MKYSILIIATLFFSFAVRAQTVENIRVEQDGDKLEITYRIGASSESQLFNVILSCSMDGGSRFEPKAVIGDVGGNIIGGKSYYTIVWDVFEDVDEVINPEFFVRVEKIVDSEPVSPVPVTRNQEQPVQKTTKEDQPVQEATKEEQPVQETKKEDPAEFEPSFDINESNDGPDFSRNGFFAYNGALGFGIPFGVSFGSLNKWGYYVTPMRVGLNIYSIEYYDSYWQEWYYENEFDFHYMLAAGVNKHFVSGGPYRLHGYFGLGFHGYVANVNEVEYETFTDSHIMLETGVINAIGGFNLTLGLSYSIGYFSPLHFVFGVGFVF